MSDEYLRIKIDPPPIQKDHAWIEKENAFKSRLTDLEAALPVNQITQVVVDLEKPEVIDVAGAMQREETINQIIALENQGLPQLFSDISYTSPIFLSEHHRQDKGHSCVIATILNTLEALGEREDSADEQELAAELGHDGSESGVDVNSAIHLLESKGLVVQPVSDWLRLIHLLENGGVAMQTVPFSSQEMHEVLVSAVSIERGNIYFSINDPLATTPSKINLHEMSKLIGRDICNTWAVEPSPEISVIDPDEPEIIIT